jgi:pyruvate/2-oxoacid:ferredoxin oxidoreductase beta subunit
MKKIMIIISLIGLLSAAPLCGAEGRQDNPEVTVPEGMETIKRGDVNLVVYKGGQSHKENDVMITENTDEYASRKFSDSEERFKGIEKELESQKKEIENLKGAVKKLEEDVREK